VILLFFEILLVFQGISQLRHKRLENLAAFILGLSFQRYKLRKKLWQYLWGYFSENFGPSVFLLKLKIKEK
jgi:hypothetical protein